MHSAPRFGHTNQFSALFSSTAETEDYAKGLIFAASFIVATFLAWLLILLFLKCLGKNRVGFLSGAAFTTSGPRPFYIRIAFVNAAILFIVFTVLVVTQGITNLNSAVTTVGDTNTEVNSILSDARGISISLKSLAQSSAQVREELTNNLGNFCPAEPNIEVLTGIDFDVLASEAIVLLNELGDFIENDVKNMQQQIEAARETSNLVANTVDEIETNDWQALVILIPYLILGTILLVSVGLAWFNMSGPFFTCFLSWGILPIFIAATIAAFCFSAFVCLTAVANAGTYLLEGCRVMLCDVALTYCSRFVLVYSRGTILSLFLSTDACSGGAAKTPDATVYAVLDNQGLDKQSLYYTAIRYYIEVSLLSDEDIQRAV